MFLTVLTAFAEVTAIARQSAAPPRSKHAQTANALPPLSYICPMPGDEDVIEDKPGRCPKCGMELEPIRLDSVWTCPVHAAVTKEQPGKCPIDGRQLVPVTMAVSWTCPAVAGSKDSLTPGTCADGTPMVKKFSPRPHGNHNPQHGGAFFMAPDNWHHLEGAYFPPGLFRLYLYDDFTKPLPVAAVRATQARVTPAKDGKELPLVRNGRVLEAKIGKLPFPAVMQAKVRFTPDGPEHLFDFTFDQVLERSARSGLGDDDHDRARCRASAQGFDGRRGRVDRAWRGTDCRDGSVRRGRSAGAGGDPRVRTGDAGATADAKRPDQDADRPRRLR